eukprot:5591911-Amphidinium_carterae.2
MARFDLLRPVSVLASAITKWTPGCDKALWRLMSYIDSSRDLKLVAEVGDDVKDNVTLKLNSSRTPTSLDVHSLNDSQGDPHRDIKDTELRSVAADTALIEASRFAGASTLRVCARPSYQGRQEAQQ